MEVLTNYSSIIYIKNKIYYHHPQLLRIELICILSNMEFIHSRCPHQGKNKRVCMKLHTKLDLHYNSFGGSIPCEFSSFKKLLYLDLSANLIEGQISKFIGIFCTLKTLSLAGNMFVMKKENSNTLGLEVRPLVCSQEA